MKINLVGKNHGELYLDEWTLIMCWSAISFIFQEIVVPGKKYTLELRKSRVKGCKLIRTEVTIFPDYTYHAAWHRKYYSLLSSTNVELIKQAFGCVPEKFYAKLSLDTKEQK